MKATITRPDGTRIEAEGTPEELRKLEGMETAPHVCQPCLLPHFVPVPTVQPIAPWQPWQPVWYVGDGTYALPRLPPPNAAGAAPAMGPCWVGELRAPGMLQPSNAACAQPTAAEFFTH